jgi:hypothetical protein
MGRVDLERPWEAGRTPEELLVEVIADPADRLGDQERRRGGVEESRDVGAAAAQDPEASEGAGGDAAPDAEAAVPDRKRSPPMRRHFVPARRQEVKTPADEPRGNGPDRYVLNQVTIAAHALPTARGDRHRREDGDDIGESVGVDEERPDVKAA